MLMAAACCVKLQVINSFAPPGVKSQSGVKSSISKGMGAVAASGIMPVPQHARPVRTALDQLLTAVRHWQASSLRLGRQQTFVPGSCRAGDLLCLRTRVGAVSELQCPKAVSCRKQGAEVPVRFGSVLHLPGRQERKAQGQSDCAGDWLMPTPASQVARSGLEPATVWD